MKCKKASQSTNLPLAVLIAILMLVGTVSASAWNETVLHSFRSGNDDGLAPYGRVISDAAGNLYGTTAFGGTSGAGIVFALTNPKAPRGWTETILYNFSGGSDGSQPYGGLIFDSAGNLYGTTFQGGASNAGTVYELTPGTGGAWTETVIYNFAGGTDGSGSQSDLNFDQAGNLFGTTASGGSPGNGIVFELTPGKNGLWTETVLHRFLTSEGTSPRAAVIFDKNGSLYGTLANDGTFGGGAVFRLKPTNSGTWTEKTLYQFGAGQGNDGTGPLCTLILYRGSLYGTTVNGGANGGGVIFQLKPPASRSGAWTETVLHSFDFELYPQAGLIVDTTGVFYGTTQRGGFWVGGTVFQLKQASGTWTVSDLYSFRYNRNKFATAGLLLGKNGALYGTTIGSEGHAGMVFKLWR